MTGSPRELLTAEELLVHPDNRYGELVAGTLRVAEPPGGIHGRLASRIDRRLGAHVERHRLGTVLVEAGYVLSRNPDTVRGPDISFVSRERLDPDQIPDAFITSAPDLAVEILSPSDSGPEVLEKVADYLQAGARLVWVMNADARSVTVYHPARAPHVVAGREQLDGEDVVPGFSCAVSDLFG